MFKILKSSRGVGFIGFVIIIGVVMLGLVGAVMTSLSGARKEAARFRRGTTSLLMMQQLGSIALKAHNDFTSQNDCLHVPGSTPVGNNGAGAGNKAFCQPAQICISDPDDASLDNNDAITVCSDDDFIRFEKMDITQEGNQVSIDFNIHHKDLFKKWKYAYYDFVLKAHDFAFEKLEYATNSLSAQVSVPFDFDTGAPAVAKPSYCNQAGCGNACVGTLCKECAAVIGGAYPADEVPCMRFRVCPRMVACDAGNPGQWYVQKIGILQNAAAPPGPL